MLIFICFALQLVLLLAINFFIVIINPSTYMEKMILIESITMLVFFVFIFGWRTPLKLKTKISTKNYIAFIMIGIGICLFHRIIFIIFPQISLNLYQEIEIEGYKNTFSIWKNPVTFIYTSFLGPILEEVFYRGKILEASLEKHKPLYAIIISSALFAIVHNNPVQFVSALCLGILCGYVYTLTRDIKAPIVIHVANNFYSALGAILVSIKQEYSISNLRIAVSIMLGMVLLGWGIKICINTKN